MVLRSVIILHGSKVCNHFTWFQSLSSFYMVPKSVIILHGSKVCNHFIWFQDPNPNCFLDTFRYGRIFAFLIYVSSFIFQIEAVSNSAKSWSEPSKENIYNYSVCAVHQNRYRKQSCSNRHCICCQNHRYHTVRKLLPSVLPVPTLEDNLKYGERMGRQRPCRIISDLSIIGIFVHYQRQYVTS